MGFFINYLRTHIDCKESNDYDVLAAFEASQLSDQITAEKIFKEDLQRIALWSPSQLQRWALKQHKELSCLKTIKYQEFWTNMSMERSINVETRAYYEYKFRHADKSLKIQDKQDEPEGSLEQDDTVFESQESEEQEICKFNKAELASDVCIALLKVEHDDHSIDIEFPSDISNDYHPLVDDEEYNLQRVDSPDDTQSTRTWSYQLDDKEVFCDIIEELRTFRNVSFKFEPKSLSDLRLLALNHTYLFTQNIKDSITSYLPESLHRRIMEDVSTEPIVTISDRAILWCTKLSLMRLPTWYEVQKVTIPFLHEAMETMNDKPIDLVVANIIHRAALLFSNGTPDSDLEDSFMHNFISTLFEDVFMLDTILESKWANGQLGKRKRDDQTQFKPDYVIFITQRSNRLDLSCVEAKSPINKHTFPKSDLVKLGQEMRWMLNKLVMEGVEKPVVGGILISGFQIQTYKMELIDIGVYRMVELSKTLFFRNIQELTLIPTIVSNLLQLKNVILSTAKKANDRLCSKSKGIFPRHDPPISWLRDADFDLVKRSKTKDQLNTALPSDFEKAPHKPYKSVVLESSNRKHAAKERVCSKSVSSWNRLRILVA
ncbi:hypothetical protein BD408DRAFT_444635 [Parasitella parasitica]|nr:hypothetical protein BD408DRAFT_444635 [Parasitella parasitica]